MGLFSRTPPPQRPLEIWENNPHFGMPFNTAVYQCETSEELAALVVGYKMSNKELDWYEERINQLMDQESMELYADDAKKKAEEFVSRTYGRGHPEFAPMVEKQTKVEMETEWSIRQSIDATSKPALADGTRGHSSPAVDRQHRQRCTDGRGIQCVRTGQETGRTPSVPDGATRTVNRPEAVRTVK